MVQHSSFGNDHLGLNSNGKAIAKRPPQPRVYNISKNDFRSLVQQLTGSPTRHLPPPPATPKASRLQKGRPNSLFTPMPSPPPPPRRDVPPRLPAVADSPVSAYMGSLNHLIVGGGKVEEVASSPRPGEGLVLASPTWSFLDLLSPAMSSGALPFLSPRWSS